jgi:hypothetical protein
MPLFDVWYSWQAVVCGLFLHAVRRAQSCSRIKAQASLCGGGDLYTQARTHTWWHQLRAITNPPTKNIEGGRDPLLRPNAYCEVKFLHVRYTHSQDWPTTKHRGRPKTTVRQPWLPYRRSRRFAACSYIPWGVCDHSRQRLYSKDYTNPDRTLVSSMYHEGSSFYHRPVSISLRT